MFLSLVKKMVALIGLSFFFAFAIGAETLAIESAVYSSPDTALRFSRCLIEEMTESEVFTFEDRSNMLEVANAMADSMQNRQFTTLSGRIEMVAFMTSAADVIIIDDAAKNTRRKELYATALDQCSSSTIGYVDTEFVDEALKILSAIEHSKAPKFEETGAFDALEFDGTYVASSNPQVPSNLNPFAVRPSPVQNPYAPEYYPNVKTAFQPPQSSPFSGTQLETRSDYRAQSTSQMGFSSDSSATRISQTGGFKINSDASSMSQSGSLHSYSDASSVYPSSGGLKDISPHSAESGDINFTNTYQPSFGGLSIPQTKESTVVVIPPLTSQQTGQVSNPPLEPGEVLYQPSSQNNSPQPPESSFFMTSAASVPQTQEKASNIPSNPALENIVLNILTNSATFREAFSPGIPKENAINLARAITEQSLAGYDLNIVNEALAAVSDAVARVSSSSPENYAFALSNALVSVLKMNKLPMFVDGSKFATNFLSNLDNAKQPYSQPEDSKQQPKQDYVQGETVNSGSQERQVDFDFQSPPISPEAVDEEIFSEALKRCLSDSDKIASFFCSGNVPENRMQIYFSMIKSALVEYGSQISSIAASTASGTLYELPNQQLCFNYARTISEIIAEVLDENGIHGANAESISNKMELILSQQQITTTEFQRPDSTSDSVPSVNTRVVPYETIPTFQSSFSTNFGESSYDVSPPTTIFHQPSADSMTQPFVDKNYMTSHDITEGIYNTGPISYTVPPSTIQIPAVKETEPGYTIPVTIAYATEISDEEFTNALTLFETIESLSEALSTESGVEFASDDVIDQETLADYLLHQFESALEAYNHKDGEQEESSIPIEEIPDTTVTANSEGDIPQTSVGEITSQSVEGNCPKNPQNRRRKKKRRTTTPQPEIVTSPLIQTVKNGDFETANPTLPSSDIENSNSQHGSGSEILVEGKAASRSNVNADLVELQPSFQSPLAQTDTESSSSMAQPTPGTLPGNYEYEDASLVFARQVSQIAASSIAYIRSHGQNSDIHELCNRLNELAPIANIPPLDYCQEIAAIDYILNVLQSVTKMLKGV